MVALLNASNRKVRVVKASRERVFAAADEVLSGGQRPTLDALQSRLGGGSPNGILAYLREWYADLGERLARIEAPAEGLTPEVHRAALLLQAAVAKRGATHAEGENTETLLRTLRAEVVCLPALLEELRSQRARDQQLLADARALLVKKDEDLRAHYNSELDLRSALSVADDRLQLLVAASRVRPRRKTLVRPQAGAQPRSGGRSRPHRNAKARSHPKPQARRRRATKKSSPQRTPPRRQVRSK